MKMQLKSTSAAGVQAIRSSHLPASLVCCALIFALTLVRNEALAIDPGNRPPAGTQLAFVRDDQIYLVNSDGTGLAQLTDTEGGIANGDPAWSRDGQRLAFARGGPDGDRDIFIMNADGSNVVRLTSGGYNVEPTWGPDDREIAFTSRLAGSEGVSVIDADAGGGQGSRVVFDSPGWDAQPAWSPDGQTITFTSDFFQAYDFHYDLGAMNADGSDVRPLVEGPFFSDDGLTYYFQSAWSPDGQSIAVVVCPYAWDNCYPDSAIAVVNADGSGLKAIAQAGSYARPTWSPDGRWIAYGSSPCRGCQSSVRFAQADGGTEGLIVDDGHSPAWRPETGARINVGHSGAWYNPATSGQGQFLDVDADEQSVFLGWFTYTDDASDNPNEQHWFTAEGHYSDSTAELILYESVGGRFDHPQAVTTLPVGDVTLTFSDCGHGTLSYRFDDRDLEGSFPMTRAIPGSGNMCESRSGSTTQTVEVNHGMDGAWFDPASSGQGFFFDAHAGEDGSEFIFVSWFTYGDNTASGQRWLTAQGQFEGSQADLMIYDTHGGSFDDPQPAESVQVGTISIDFSDCSNALLSYSLDDGHDAGEMAISRLIPGGQALCEELSAPD
jgi:hypothetical protein